MNVTADPTKHIQEIVFSSKNGKEIHPGVMFNIKTGNLTATLNKSLCMMFNFPDLILTMWT